MLTIIQESMFLNNHIVLFLQQSSKSINVSEVSSSPDDKFHFLLETSKRSNMTCLQLFTKETEDFPGNAAASSLIYRHLNGHGDNSTISLDAKVCLPFRSLCLPNYILKHPADVRLSVSRAC